ncbi:MAG TPA: NUDIX domain-containing protein [Panacibacter sp.]|nr:NUDIX domain-containing protein [Panacibacter sp.]
MQTKTSYFSDAARLPLDCLPHISVDCIILGYHDKQMKILCTEIKGMPKLKLPGGFVEKNENVDDAAYRILEEKTGLKGVFLKQFKTYGSINRTKDKAFNLEHLLRNEKVKPAIIKWISQRFVSVAYYALTEYSKVIPEDNFINGGSRWYDIHDMPPLVIDHEQMVQDALKVLQLQIHNEPIGYNLLPLKFTLPELQALYETILDKKLDQRNFTKKLMSIDIIRKLDEKKYIGGHRSPSLYKFNKRNYNKALKDGVMLAF